MFPLTHNKLLDWLERAAWSFIQGGVGALPVMLALNTNQGHAVIMAAVSGGLTSLVTFVKAFFLNNNALKNADPKINILERFVWTFAAAFIGTLPVTATLTYTALGTIWTAAVTAGIAAVFSLAKNLTGTNVITQTLRMIPVSPTIITTSGSTYSPPFNIAPGKDSTSPITTPPTIPPPIPPTTPPSPPTTPGAI